MRQAAAAHLVTSIGREGAYFFALMAEAFGRGGQIAEGLGTVTGELDRAQKTGGRFYEAELHRIKGELLLRQAGADEQQAEACFQNALKVARGQSAKSLELRAVMSLCRLWQRQDKQTHARQLLAELYGWFTEGFDTADLKAAKALLEELGGEGEVELKELV
jgi:predicted ATPase